MSAILEKEISPSTVRGAFNHIDGEDFYKIENVSEIPDFFISVVSHADHWLFVSSNGGLTAGRVSPETALFPYTTVDKIHDSVGTTGCVTLMHVKSGGQTFTWEPFGRLHDPAETTRSLYKSVLGNKLCFEETHRLLGLTFRYQWSFSDAHGFVRRCTLDNHSGKDVQVDLLDGFLNVLPAGAPRFAQTNTSNLVDAYKWTELDHASGVACFTLYSGITDRAEPFESLRANTIRQSGLPQATVSLSAEQVTHFRRGLSVTPESITRGKRGAYLVNATLTIPAQEKADWLFTAEVEQDQVSVVALQQDQQSYTTLSAEIANAEALGNEALSKIMASADGFQATAEQTVSVHHYANVMFNVLRGGIFNDQYQINRDDLKKTVASFDHSIGRRHASWFDNLPETLRLEALLKAATELGDPQVIRLCREYLPIRFGRRHGDPSRPWNQFAIELVDEANEPLLSYQGNWRDVFQNWEALAFSYPNFVESMIAKFVNASTVDGYNPYRITNEGIDWEVEEPDDPWSYIGYWGDHQIIYLQKLLELSGNFNPDRLKEMLGQRVFCYANVPYRIRGFDALLADPKNTVDFDEDLAGRIEHEVTKRGADGKLVLDPDGNVYRVNLTEKLLVPLLAKLSNLVVDGGVWLNTQRPEWNDANNALVGNGLSMVTLYYMRRFVTYQQTLFTALPESVSLSSEVAEWLNETASALAQHVSDMGGKASSPADRFSLLESLGRAGERYREKAYGDAAFRERCDIASEAIQGLLASALTAIDQSIATNRRDDGMYQAYNILEKGDKEIDIESLYPMLEGQVAALSSGAIKTDEAIEIISALFASPLYLKNEQSFLLYPDRALPKYLDRNKIPTKEAKAIGLIKKMTANADHRLVVRDSNDTYRFQADLNNQGAVAQRLETLRHDYADAVDRDAEKILDCYERVFDHRAFTGRSGTMFGFEGLGCIYWHMVSKFLLAVQECYFAAQASDAQTDSKKKLGELYYQVRNGIGFNKTPLQYGAFPTDPYSHTHGNGGAKQPGMTGQVKEEILTRFGELGIHVTNGCINVSPTLLRQREFSTTAHQLRYLDVNNVWQDMALPESSLAFTWCQIPIVYVLDDDREPTITIELSNDESRSLSGMHIPRAESRSIFDRLGTIACITVILNRQQLLD
ncbi:MAG: hypothetical protein AB8F65_15220 [Woeseiaceae bacterium]